MTATSLLRENDLVRFDETNIDRNNDGLDISQICKPVFSISNKMCEMHAIYLQITHE